MKNKYILGAGISGLIFNHYNPEYKIISPDIGGQLKKHKNVLITFYVHNHELTRNLLDELKIKYKEKRLRIYYNYYGKILENLTTKQRAKFIKNKLTEYDYDSNSITLNNLNLSTANNHLDILITDVNKMIEKLTPKTFIDAEVKLVNNNRKFMLTYDSEKKLNKLNYYKLASTIPAKVFFPLMYNYKCDYNFNYLPATFVLSKTKPDFMEDESMYYICDDKIIYNRVQPYADGYVYEITGIPSDEEIHRQIPDVLEIEKRYVGIIKDDPVNDFKNIKFIGRLACWDSNIKIQQVIEKAIKQNGKNTKK